MKAPKKVGVGNQYYYGWLSPDREWLEDQFWALGKTICRISEETGACGSTVRRWAKELDLGPLEVLSDSPPRKFLAYGADGRSKWIEPGKSWLKSQLSQKSMNALADELGCGWWTVDLWVRKLRIDYDRSRVGERNPSWKGGTSRGHGRKAIGQAGVLEQCIWCSQSREGAYSMHLHHKDHDKRNNKLENLCWLCDHCHRLETALWNLLKKDKIDLECKDRTMVIKFRDKGE